VLLAAVLGVTLILLGLKWLPWVMDPQGGDPPGMNLGLDAPIREDLGERTDHCNYPDGKVVLYPAVSTMREVSTTHFCTGSRGKSLGASKGTNELSLRALDT
jgi:hypothetical protein